MIVPSSFSSVFIVTFTSSLITAFTSSLETIVASAFITTGVVNLAPSATVTVAAWFKVREATVLPAPIFNVTPVLSFITILFPLAFSFQVPAATSVIVIVPFTVDPLFTVAFGVFTVKLPVIVKLRRLMFPLASPAIVTSPLIVLVPVAGP